MAKSDSKKRAIFLIQLALVGFFSVGMYSYMQKELSPTTVYVYKNRISKNSEIEISDLTTKTIPVNAKDSSFLTENDVEKIKQGLMVVSTDVEAGQYAYSSQVKEGKKVDPFETMDLTNYRKISIPVSYETSVAGEIEKGDKIDLVFVGEVESTANNGSSNGGSYAKTFMQEVLVYSVTTGEGFEYVSHSHLKKSESSAAITEDGSTVVPAEDITAPTLVTIAVPLNQAEEILARLEKGSVKILGRFEESEYTSSSGYVFGTSTPQSVYAGEKNVESK